MRKITIILILMLSVPLGLQVNAQIFSEDFESGLGAFENDASNSTDWEINTVLYHGGAQSAHDSYDVSNENVLFQSSSIDLSVANNPQLSFWQIAKTEGGYDNCIVEISTDDGASFQPLATDDYQGAGALADPGTFDEDSYPDWGTTDVEPTNDWWKQEFFDLSSYNTATVVIRFRLTSDTSVLRSGWYIDDIEINEVSCPQPSGLISENITPNTADITWTLGASETEWEIIYGNPGFDPESEGNTISDNDGTIGETISGLTPDTQYDYYVRAVCGAGDNSVWVGPESFMTTPTCPQPTDLTVGTVTETSAEVSWTIGASETEWEIIYGAPSFDPSTEGTPVADTDGTIGETISGLTPETSYEFYVKAICGVGDESLLSGPISFYTGYCIFEGTNGSYYIDNFVTSGAQVNIDNSGSGFTPGGYNDATSMAVSQYAGGTVDFTANMVGGTFGVNIWVDWNNDMVFDESEKVYASGGYVSPAEGSFDVPIGTANGNYRMRIAATWIGVDPAPCGTTAYGEAEDYTFTVVDPPSCVQPSNVQASMVSDDTVEVSWTAIGSEDTWNIIYGPEGFTPGDGSGTEVNGVTDNPHEIPGLTPGENYDVYVQADCGGGDTSVNAGPANFHVPGPGEDCGDPIEITALPYNTTDDTTDYGDNYGGGTAVDCDTPNYYLNGNDVVYSYTPADDTSVDINISELTGTYSGLFVYASCDDIGVECVASYGNGSSTADFSIEELMLTGGETYYIVISTWAAPQTVGYTLDIIENTCLNPTANYNVVSDCDSGTDQFYVEVDVTDLGTANTVSISDGNGMSEDNVGIGTYSNFGPYPNGTNVVITIENDDDPSCVITSSGLTQNFCPPENNDPCDAVVAQINNDQFCVNVTPGTVAGATNSNVPGGCASSTSIDVWYKFTAQSSTHMTALLNASMNSSADLSSAIYSGTCDNLQQLFCSTEFVEFGDSPNMVATGLTIGETYWVRVFGDAGSTDEFNLCITTPDYQPNASCEEIEPFCAPTNATGDPEPLIFPNGYFYLTESVAEEDIDFGCVTTQPNPAWYYLQVDQPGDLDFEIVQNSAFDGNGNPIGNGLDVDFVAWGPFDSVDDICINLDNDHRVPGVSYSPYDGCDYSTATVETLGIDNSQQGEIYVVLITNFRQTPGYISLGQTNFGNTGGGTTNCSIINSHTYTCGEEGVDETVLTSQNTDAVAYTWYYKQNEDDEYPATPFNVTDMSVTVTDAGYYQLISYSAEGIPQPEVFRVEYAPKPELDLDGDTVPDNPDDVIELSLCGQPNLDLDASPLNPADFGTIEYSWLDENGNEVATTATYTITQPGEYVVTVSGQVLDENNNPVSGVFCEITETIVVNAANFNVNIGTDQTFCGVDSYTITANMTGEDPADADFVWSDADGPIAGETSQSLTVTESGTYSVEVTVDGCSPGPKTVTITFNHAPEIDLGDDINTCSLSGIVIDGTPSNVNDISTVHFTWTYNGNDILDGDGAAFATVNVEDYDYGTFSVVAYTTDPNCVSNTETINVNERTPSVALTINDDDALYCIGETATLTAELTDATADEATFEWSDDNGPIPAETGQSLNIDIDNAYTSENYYVTVTIGECEAVSDPVTIGKYPNGCDIPRGMSPGNDEINNCLDLTFLSDRSGIKSLKIYNRYGRLVYEMNNYVDSWCGQDKDGNDLVTGTYYYVLEFEKKDPVFGKSRRSWIYINRVSN